MNYFTLSVLFFFQMGELVKSASIEEVRLLYQKAAEEEKACKQLMDLLSPYDENKPLMLGYKGSATMMMAEYVFNPVKKLYYFNKGKEMLSIAIMEDEQNVELRFLRFAVQTKIPSFLGFGDFIERDKAYLLKNIAGLDDAELKRMILSFLKDSEHLTLQERKLLN